MTFIHFFTNQALPMKHREEQQIYRSSVSTLNLTNEKTKVRKLYILSKKRSNSCPDQYTNKKGRSIESKLSLRRVSERNLSPKEKYKDESYFYRNLHNQKLWSWQSPMEYCEFKKTPKSRPYKVNVSVLERFKNYMETRVGKRVPLAVEDILNQTKNQI